MKLARSDKRAVCPVCQATVGVVWRQLDPFYRRHPRGAPAGEACRASYGVTVDSEDFVRTDKT